jgi:hypothetical protein
MFSFYLPVFQADAFHQVSQPKICMHSLYPPFYAICVLLYLINLTKLSAMHKSPSSSLTKYLFNTSFPNTSYIVQEENKSGDVQFTQSTKCILTMNAAGRVLGIFHSLFMEWL